MPFFTGKYSFNLDASEFVGAEVFSGTDSFRVPASATDTFGVLIGEISQGLVGSQLSALPDVVLIDFANTGVGAYMDETGVTDLSIYAHYTVTDASGVVSEGVDQIASASAEQDQVLAAQFSSIFGSSQFFKLTIPSLPADLVYHGTGSGGSDVVRHYDSEYFAVDVAAFYGTASWITDGQAGRFLIASGQILGQRDSEWGPGWLNTIVYQSTPPTDDDNPWDEPDDHLLDGVSTYDLAGSEGRVTGLVGGIEVDASTGDVSILDEVQGSSPWSAVTGAIKSTVAGGKSVAYAMNHAFAGLLSDVGLDAFLTGASLSSNSEFVQGGAAFASQVNGTFGVKTPFVQFNTNNLDYMRDLMEGRRSPDDDFEGYVNNGAARVVFDAGSAVAGGAAGWLHDSIVRFTEAVSYLRRDVTPGGGSKLMANAGPTTGPADVLHTSLSAMYSESANPDLVKLGNGYSDTYFGDMFADRIDFGDGNDVAYGADGDDRLVGGSGDDLLIGGAGGDRLDGGSGADRLIGGSGDDSYIVDNVADRVFETIGNGSDLVLSSVTFSLAGQYIERLTLSGGGDINATGNSLANHLTGNSGANRLNGGAGADVMAGGAGNDVYIVDDAGDVVTELAGQGSDRVESSVSYTLGDNVENLYLTGSALTGTGNALANLVKGNSQNNILDGGAGADDMRGGKGEDIYFVDNAGDKVVELDGEGNDTVNSSVTFSLANQYIEVLNLTGSAAINGTGNGLNNRIVGNSAANTLVGGDGNDRLDGGGGADTLKGGLGNDTYVVENAGDKITENNGDGTDTVEAWISYSLVGQYIETLKLMGSDNLGATGNGQVNALYGNAGNNMLNGMAGADTMAGGAGDDTYVVDDAGDKVIENANEGTDLVQSSVTFSLANQYIEALTLTGSAAVNGTGNNQANTLTGNTAANTLNGSGGDDQLHGGLGSDTLTGGAGLDTFWFETALGASNVDTITDFKAADDTINLDRTIFSGITANGALAGTAFYQGAAAHDADDRIVYDKASGNIYYDADGTGAGAAVLFAHVAANTALTAADFFAVA